MLIFTIQEVVPALQESTITKSGQLESVTFQYATGAKRGDIEGNLSSSLEDLLIRVRSCSKDFVVSHLGPQILTQHWSLILISESTKPWTLFILCLSSPHFPMSQIILPITAVRLVGFYLFLKISKGILHHLWSLSPDAVLQPLTWTFLMRSITFCCRYEQQTCFISSTRLKAHPDKNFIFWCPPRPE